jgi:competence protein ComEC
VASPQNIVKYHPLNTSAIRELHTIRFLPERIRHFIAAFLDKTLKQPARGLDKAILIGDRTDVPPSVLENFTSAGCIHILAISGVHMGLLALVITVALTWLLKRSQWLLLSSLPLRKFVACAALFPLLIYALIAGFNIPVLRAFLMTVVLLLSISFRPPPQPFQSYPFGSICHLNMETICNPKRFFPTLIFCGHCHRPNLSFTL